MDTTKADANGQGFSIENTQWKEAKDLLPGDVSLSADGATLQVLSVEIDQRQETVYNFEVEDFHTYFVGEVGVWVHNQATYYTITTRSYHPSFRFGGGFHGDNRGFSLDESEKTTSRISNSTKINFEKEEIVTGESGTKSDKSSHILGGNKSAEPATNSLLIKSKSSLKSFEVEGYYEASNPLISSPDIDVKYNYRILKTEKNKIVVSSDVKGDGFPNAESFIKDSSGTKVSLGTFSRPQFSSPFITLFGNGNKQMISENVTILTSEKGNFQGIESEKHNQSMTIEQWNKKHINKNPGTSIFDGFPIIDRNK